MSSVLFAIVAVWSLLPCMEGAPAKNQQEKFTEPKTAGYTPKIQDPYHCPPQNLGNKLLLGTVGCDICVSGDFSTDGLIGIDCIADSNGQSSTRCRWEQTGEELKMSAEVIVAQGSEVATIFFLGNHDRHMDQSYTCVCENEFGKDTKEVKLIKSLAC